MAPFESLNFTASVARFLVATTILERTWRATAARTDIGVIAARAGPRPWQNKYFIYFASEIVKNIYFVKGPKIVILFFWRMT